MSEQRKIIGYYSNNKYLTYLDMKKEFGSEDALIAYCKEMGLKVEAAYDNGERTVLLEGA